MKWISRAIVLVIFISQTIHAFNLKGQLQGNYLPEQKASEKTSLLGIEHEFEIGQSLSIELKANHSLYSYSQETETRFTMEDFFFNLKLPHRQRLKLGIISPNLNHIDVISSLSPHRSFSYLNPLSPQWIGSPGAYYKYASGKHQWELLALAKKRENQLVPKFSAWLPRDTITEIDSESNTLFLNDDTEFYYKSSRILEKSLNSNLLLKYSYENLQYRLGFFAFQGSSTPQMYFDVSTQLVTVGSSSQLQADSDVGIIPTYFKEFHLGHFGEWTGESVIVKWELSNKRDLSEESYIDLNTTTGIVNFEWNTNLGSFSGLHNLSLYMKTDKQSSSSLYASMYELLDQNVIYNFIISKETQNQWAININQKINAPKGSSLGLSWTHKYNDWLEYKLLGLKFMGTQNGIYKSFSKNSFAALQIGAYW